MIVLIKLQGSHLFMGNCHEKKVDPVKWTPTKEKSDLEVHFFLTYPAMVQISRDRAILNYIMLAMISLSYIVCLFSPTS